MSRSYLAIRNVAGEMHGAMYAVQWAFENGYSSVVIHYDYEGIEKWATGVWSAKNPHTKKYAAFMRADAGEDGSYFPESKRHTPEIFITSGLISLAKEGISRTGMGYRLLMYIEK